MTQLFGRHEAIIGAYETALGSRDPDKTDIIDLLPTIYRLVPGVRDDEIVSALRWAANQCEREADALERLRRSRGKTGENGNDQ